MIKLTGQRIVHAFPWWTIIMFILACSLSVFSWLYPALFTKISQLSDSKFYLYIFSAFYHPFLAHLVSNSAFLLVFGIPVEQRIGNGRFFVIITLVHIAIYSLVQWEPDLDSLYGLSSSVSSIIGLYAVTLSKRKLGMLIPLGLWPLLIRIPASLLILIWALTQLFFYWQKTTESHIAWQAHILGFVLGIIVGVLLKHNRRIRYTLNHS
ncbi:MAG: rhomboid family intramembrane serine protease [bacterium]